MFGYTMFILFVLPTAIIVWIVVVIAVLVVVDEFFIDGFLIKVKRFFKGKA